MRVFSTRRKTPDDTANFSAFGFECSQAYRAIHTELWIYLPGEAIVIYIIIIITDQLVLSDQ